MGLPPLEYIDCFLDSPTFRETIVMYEKELESNAAQVKALVRECQQMISATEAFSKAQLSFAQVLMNFKFQTIGEQTEDEKMIMDSFQTFAKLLFSIEDYRHNMLSTISVRLLKTLESFRKEQIHATKEEKKKFDRSSDKYYQSLERKLSAKKKELVGESDFEVEHLGFRQAAFSYACKLQDVHAQKEYELVEPIIGYIGDVTTFLHLAYDSASSLKPELNAVQFKIQILRETHESEQEKAYQLKAQVIEDGEAGLFHHPEFPRQGYLMVQDKNRPGLGAGWHRYFCQFRKKDMGKGKIRQMRLIPVGHHGQLPTTDFMEVTDCIRSKSEEVERKNCFDVEFNTLRGETKKYTLQGTSVDERKAWLEILEGKEPTYSNLKIQENKVTNEGFLFVKKCIEAIEERGLDEQGLYRRPGIISLANKLVKDAMEKGKLNSLNLKDEFEYDTKTIASAIKAYFNKQLGQPLLTFNLHQQFIDAAKIPERDKRVEQITLLAQQLPPDNRSILILLMQHLNRVASHSERNLMKASNLGVVFGPTLMRPERETVATIVDIKYQNLVAEAMIAEMEKIFPESDQEVPPPSPVPSAFPSAPPSISPTPTPNSKKDKPTPPVNKPMVPQQSSVIRRQDRPHLPPKTNRLSSPNIAQQQPMPNFGPAPLPPPRPNVAPKLSLPKVPSSEDSDERRKPIVPKPTYRTAATDGSSYRQHHRLLTTSAENGKPTVMRGSEHPSVHISQLDNFRNPRSARALYDCNAEDSLELSFKKDEILYNVTESPESDWLQASRGDGTRGLVPANYLEFLP